ncbi:acyltransferase [Limibacter armeniacum]|uniref:acyltransferase family protein n=1 Tax=Limibacter armeniacum TaxID=466084 RepID=UPI002FE58D87
MKHIQYFPGLNALRFIAAYLVVLHHAESVKLGRGFFHLHDYTLFSLGGLSVTFFFVLSGFLISYLLFKELEKKNDVSVRKFYMRRVLRIWPLYFLMVLTGLVIVPTALTMLGADYQLPYDPGEVAWMYVLFLPFAVNALFGHTILYPLWSIGVEEVFYITWAPIVKFFSKYLINIFIGIIIIRLSLDYYFTFIDPTHPFVASLVRQLQIDAMAFGGLGAYFIYHTQKSISSMQLFTKKWQLILFAVIVVRCTCHNFLMNDTSVGGFIYQVFFATPVFSSLFTYFLFLWMIINVSLNVKTLFRLEHPIMNKLGDISYGIYMYHLTIVFAIVFVLGDFLAGLPTAVGFILYHLMVIVSVISVSYLSKTYFEDQFLKLKGKFSFDKHDEKKATVNAAKQSM